MDEQSKLDLEEARSTLSRIEYLAADEHDRFGSEICDLAESGRERLDKILADAGEQQKPASKAKPKRPPTKRAAPKTNTTAKTGNTNKLTILKLFDAHGPMQVAHLAGHFYGDEYTAYKNGPMARTLNRYVAEGELLEDGGFYRLSDAGHKLVLDA